VLIVAFLICVPILWSALVDGSVSLESAGIRFRIALPVAAVLVGLVRLATRAPEAKTGATDDAAHDRNSAA
jgi:hypothetical protein